MRLICTAFIFVFVFAQNSLSAPGGPIESKLEQPFSQKKRLFGTLNVDHATRSYYDEEGYLLKQDPSVKTNFRAGLRYYRSHLEIFGKMGVIKRAGTQQVLQGRPVIGAYYYPAFGSWGEILLYNINELPHESDDVRSPASMRPQSQGTISTFGIAPQLRAQRTFYSWPVGLRMGVDIWSKVYSRRQEVIKEEQTSPSDLALADIMSSQVIEDDEPSLWNQIKFGLYMLPGSSGSFLTEIMAFIDTHHYPFYFTDEENHVSSDYKVRRASRLRLRATLKLTSKLYLRNDFIKEYEGLFAPGVHPSKESLRNIFQLGFHF